jgi:ankyrin repeat protein
MDFRSYHMKSNPTTQPDEHPSEDTFVPDMDATIKGLKTSLAAACHRCDVNAIKCAVTLGTNFDEICEEHTGFCPIHIAVDEGHISLVQWLVMEAKVDLTIPSEAGETPLHIACRKDHQEVVQWLLLSGADPALKNFDGDTCYHVIVAAGNCSLLKSCAEIVESLDTNLVNSKKQTLLHAACTSGSVECLLQLVDLGAFVNAIDADFKTPLHLACVACIPAGVKALLEHGALTTAKDANGCTPLHMACQGGNIDVVRYLLSLKQNQMHTLTNSGDTCLHLACLSDNYELVRLLIEEAHQDVEGVNVNDHTPLDKACSVGSIDVSKYLVHRGANVNRRNVISGRTAMHMACMYGHLRMGIWLMKKGAEVNVADKSGSTPFLGAAFFGHLRIMQWLYDTEEVNVFLTGGSTDKLNTALHLACENGHKEAARWLISIGLDLNTPNSVGITAAHHAETGGFLEELMIRPQSVLGEGAPGGGDVFYHDEEEEKAVKEAIDALENSMQRDDFAVAKTILESFDAVAAKTYVFPHGKTLVHYAAAAGHLEYLRYLIMQGYWVDAPTVIGRTPMFYAAAKGQLEVAKLLFEYGADPSVKDISGYTSLSMALKHRQGDIVQWFSTFVKDTLASEQLDFPKEEKTQGSGGSSRRIAGSSNVKKSQPRQPSSIFACFSESDATEEDYYTNHHFTPPHASEDIASELRKAEQEQSKLTSRGQQHKKINDVDEERELFEACLRGDLIRARYMVESGLHLGCRTGPESYSPLHMACMSGNVQLVQYLLSKGVALSSTATDGSTPLHVACDRKYSDLALHMIKMGADLNLKSKYGQTPLHVACSRGMTDLMKTLNDLPRSVLPSLNMHVVDRDGCNLLHTAARSGHSLLTGFLLSLDVFDIDAMNNQGHTALHLACMSNAQEIVVLLVKHNAAIDLLDISGRTAFHFACVSGNTNMARWMAQHGAQWFKTTFQGNSGLHMACALGDLPMVEWLIGQGMKCDVANSKGLTPVLLAYHSGHSEVVNYIVTHTNVRRPTGTMNKELANIDMFDK